MTSDDLAYATILEIATRYRRRDLSPVELTKALLARIERLDPALHAFVTVTTERALADARAAEAALLRGGDGKPLLGIPVGLQDIYATRGTRRPGNPRAPRRRATRVLPRGRGRRGREGVRAGARCAPSARRRGDRRRDPVHPGVVGVPGDPDGRGFRLPRARRARPSRALRRRPARAGPRRRAHPGLGVRPGAAPARAASGRDARGPEARRRPRHPHDAQASADVRRRVGPERRLPEEQHAAVQHDGAAGSRGALRLLFAGAAALPPDRRTAIRRGDGAARGPRLRAGHRVAPTAPEDLTMAVRAAARRGAAVRAEAAGEARL